MTVTRAHAVSHVGLVRSSNQDSGYAGTRLFLVADGMGGHAGGDVASAIATKHLTALDHDYSAANIRAGVEQSLRRLRTDRLDLVQLHISPSVEVLRRDAAVETLNRLRDEGKIIAFGVSSTLPALDDHLGIDEFSAFQVPFSALERELESRIELAGRRGFGIIVRGGVAQGGKREKTTADGRPVTWDETGLDELRDGDSRHGFLLRYAITTPGVTTVIAGTADPGHVRDNVAAARRGVLDEDVYAEARRRLDAAGVSSAVIEEVPVR